MSSGGDSRGGRSGAGEERFSRPLRSKGLLPAIGVGAAVYMITGFATLSTLGMVGIGAGVGYGIGTWIADKLQKRQDALGGGEQGAVDHLPWAVQLALQQWQEFVMRRAGGREFGQVDVERIWAEFERMEPTHAANARPFVRGGVPNESSSGDMPLSFARGAPVIVPTRAAEV
mmetsp:Transcript_126405/g.363563  ORF Transcript_126405/g.363563 Transcript_126405/m.363563 type:complete len:173 (-) Transcript_126405:224-742(-)